MAETILLVGRGSQDEYGNKEIESFALTWKTLHPEWHIEVCFVEFAEVLLGEGFDVAAQNACKVFVIPLILKASKHVRQEISVHMEKATKRHPDVKFIFGKYLEVNMTLLTLVLRQLEQVMDNMSMPDPKNTGVIIVDRGSSDKVENGEVAKLARWVQEDGGHELVDIAFTRIAYPRLETVVQRHVKLGMMQIVILPYYLFTGTLITRISDQVKYLQAQYPQIRFGLADYLGFEPEIYSLLDEIVMALPIIESK